MKKRICCISRIKPLLSFQFHANFLKNPCFLVKTPFFCFSTAQSQQSQQPKSNDFSEKISVAKTMKELLDIYEQSEKILSVSDIINLTKLLARMSSPESEEPPLKNDPRFSRINKFLINNMDSFSNTELLDFLFAIRKFKISKAGFNISTSEFRNLVDKISNLVSKNILNFRNLVNIHYDLSFLGSNTDQILEKISEEISLNKSLVTPSIFTQMLQAFAQKTPFGLSFKEYMTVTRLINFIEEQYKTLKIDQKCNLFKYIAKLELKYHPMKYDFPNTFFRMKNDIKSNLEKLNESLLMSIIQAYSFLPSNFPNDLLNDIKEVFVLTLRDNSKSVNSSFFIEFLENFQKVIVSKKKRSFSPEQMKLLSNFIIHRIVEKDEGMISSKAINRLMTVFELEEDMISQLLEPTNPVLYLCCLENIKSDKSILGSTVLEIFYLHKLDIIPFLEQIFKKTKIDDLAYIFRIRIYLLLNQVQRTPYLEERCSELRTRIMANVEQEPFRFIAGLKNSRIDSPQREQLFFKSIENLGKVKSQDNYLTNSFMNSMFESCFSGPLEEFWLGYFQKNLHLLNEASLIRLIDVFFTNKSEYPQHQINFFLKIMDLPDFSYECYKRLLVSLKKNTFFVQALCQNERNFYVFCIKISEKLKTQNTIKPSLIFSFLKKFEDLDFKNPEMVAILHNLTIQSIKEGSDKFLQRSLIDFLMEKQYNNDELCRELSNIAKSDSPFFPNNTKTRILNEIVGNNPTLIEQNLSLLKRYINLQKQSLVSSSFQKSNEAIKLMIGFPTKMFLQERENLKRILEKNLKNMNLKEYVEIFKHLKPEKINQNYDLYADLLFHLAKHFEVVEEKIHIEFLLVMLKTVLMIERNELIGDLTTRILNKMAFLVGKYTKYFEIIDLLNLMAKGHIVNQSLIDKLTELITKNIAKYTPFLEDILSNYYDFGGKTSFLENLIEMNKATPLIKENPEVLIKILLLWASSNEKNEDFPPEYAEIFSSLMSQKKFKPKNLLEIQLLYFYLKKTQKGKYNEIFKLFFDNNQIKVKSPEIKLNPSSLEIIEECLKAMNLQYRPNHKIQELTFDFLIPQQNFLIKIIEETSFNLLENSERGEAKIIRQIFGSVPEFKVALIPMNTFLSAIRMEEKIEFLRSMGINMEIEKEKIDFLKVKQITRLPKRFFYEKENLREILE